MPQLTEATSPVAAAPTEAAALPQPRSSRALRAYRHGLTGQIVLLTQEEQVAYDAHCRGYMKIMNPLGYVENDIAQLICDDRWRLKRAASLESAVLAAELALPDQVTCDHAEVAHALSMGKAWVKKGGNIALLSVYENRIQRRIEKNLDEFRFQQSSRGAAVEKALLEAAMLAQEAERNGENADQAIEYLLSNSVFFIPRYEVPLASLPRPRNRPRQLPARQKSRLGRPATPFAAAHKPKTPPSGVET